jgi:ATP-dependent DNA helicase RecG
LPESPDHHLSGVGNDGLSGDGAGFLRAEKDDRIRDVLAAHPAMTIPEVAAEVGKSESAVAHAIVKLVAAGRLRRVGSRKTGHWEVVG